MAIRVREASLIGDRAMVTSLTKTYLNPNADERRFDWLYRENPFGQARFWIACNRQGEAVGIAALFPRQMYAEGGTVLACVLGDFCVRPEYRSVGPALQLQRACLAAARSEDFVLAYDFPSATMMSLYHHLGVSPALNSVRHAKLLRAKGLVGASRRSIPAPLRATVDFALAIGDRRSSNDGLDFCLQATDCGAEYSSLAERIGASFGTCTVRSAEYLNWRYHRHPYLRHEFLTARRDGQLLLYCVFTHSGETATVVELFGSPQHEDLMAKLLRELAFLLRARGVATLNLPLLSTDPRKHLLRRMGFWAREKVPVVLLTRNSPVSGAMLLMHGDRES